MRRTAAIVLLTVAACGGSPELANTPVVAPALANGGALGEAITAPSAAVIERAPDPPPTESPAPEPLDAVDGGAHAGINLHAQHAPVVPDDGLAAMGSGTPPAWPRGPTVDFGRARTFPEVSGAERVIAGLRPAFRRCYQRTLERDPEHFRRRRVGGEAGTEGRHRRREDERQGPPGGAADVHLRRGKGRVVRRAAGRERHADDAVQLEPVAGPRCRVSGARGGGSRGDGSPSAAPGARGPRTHRPRTRGP